MNRKNYRRSALLPQEKRKQTGAANGSGTEREAEALLSEARRCWEGLAEMRHNRRRCRRYTFGNQWGDPICDPESGKTMTEEEYIRRQGKVPLKNNMIRQLVKSVLGQFRANRTEPVCASRDRDEQRGGEMMTAALQYVYQLNRLWELDTRLLEEFLISGFCVAKTCFGWKTGKDKQDVWVDIVNPNRVFFDNGMEDVRHWDCSLIGEVHDMKRDDVVSVFASSPEERDRIEQIYRLQDERFLYNRDENLSAERLDNLDFFTPSETGLCRVIEIWRLESRERIKCHDVLNGEYYKIEKGELKFVKAENARRMAEAKSYGVEENDVALIEYEWFTDRFWYFRFLSPAGDVLREGESPYFHKEHPSSFKLYPFLDGEIHSFVQDVIDQQRYINRMITMIDFIMGSSAKGVLMFPEEALPDGMTIEEVAEEWVKYNGVILCRTRGGVQMPQQISTNATHVGAHEMLNLQLRLLDDISGVHGAIQGRAPAVGTGASRYAQEANNSSVNLLDLFESFKMFREERDYKLMKLVQQYYREPRYLNIVGRGYAGETRLYDPERVKNCEFDLSISQSPASPVFRDSANDFLLELFRAGHITVEMLLENGNFPFADRLLQAIRSANAEERHAEKRGKDTRKESRPSAPPQAPAPKG